VGETLQGGLSGHLCSVFLIGWIEEEQWVAASSPGLRRRLRIQAEAGRPASAAERRWLSAATTTGQTVNWETGCLR
jgi:hypothetical protein